MNHDSAKALVWLSALLVFLGMLVMSPSAGLLLMVLGGLCALGPALKGAKSMRIGGIVLLALSLVLSVSFYDGFKREQKQVMDRVKKNQEAVPSPDPGQKQRARTQ